MGLLFRLKTPSTTHTHTHYLYATVHAATILLISQVLVKLMWEQTERRNVTLARLPHTPFCIQTEEKQGSQQRIVIWEGHNREGD